MHRVKSWLYLLVTLHLIYFPASQIQANELPVVRVQLKWHHQFQFAGFYAAIDQGYFEAEGLSVELMAGRPDINPSYVVANGEAEFGIGNSTLLLERQQGYPVVAIASVFQHSPFIIIARRDDAIQSVKDLEHRTLMAEAHSAELLAYLILAGVDINTINLTPHTGQVSTLSQDALYQADAMTAFLSGEPYAANRAGIPYQIFSPRDIGLDFYGDTLFTSESYANQYPERVIAMRNALLKGWRYALQNRNAMISLIMEKYAPELDSFYLNAEAQATTDLIAASYIDPGYMSLQRWQRIAGIFQSAGLLPNDFSLDGFIFREQQAAIPGVIIHSLVWSGLITLLASIAAWRFYIQKQNSEHRAERLSEETEQLLQLRQNQMAMAEVATTIAHEMNQPLAAIKNYARAAINFSRRQRINPQKLNETLYHLIHQAEMASDIVRQTRCQLDQQDYPQQPIDLQIIIRESIQLCLFNARRNNIDLIFSCHQDQAVIIGNDIQLKQMLVNLIGNAVEALSEHHIPSPAVRLTLSATGKHYIIRVQDNGPGLECTDRVFSTQFTTKHSALGMGLPICRSITEMHQGSIRAENRDTGGAEFTISIPVHSSPVRLFPPVSRQSAWSGKSIQETN